MMKYLVSCSCVVFVFLLLMMPSHALATMYTMDFGTGNSATSDSYSEDGFTVTAVDYGDIDIKVLLRGISLPADPLANSTDRNLILYQNSDGTPNQFVFDHFGLGFDLMSLDIERFGSQALLLASSGASLSLDGFGLETVYFDDVGWQNITSFSIFATKVIAIDNIVFENPPTVTAVPEPSTIFLLGFGLAGLAGVAGMRKRKK